MLNVFLHYIGIVLFEYSWRLSYMYGCCGQLKVEVLLLLRLL